MDCIFFNALAADGSPLHIGVRKGRIVSLAGLPASLESAPRVDLQGGLVLPGFVDGHIHLDKSFIGDRWHPHRAVSSLRERLAVVRSCSELEPIPV